MGVLQRARVWECTHARLKADAGFALCRFTQAPGNAARFPGYSGRVAQCHIEVMADGLS